MMDSSLLGYEVGKRDYVSVVRYLLLITVVICGTVILHDGLSQSSGSVSMNESSVGGITFLHLTLFYTYSPVQLGFNVQLL